MRVCLVLTDRMMLLERGFGKLEVELADERLLCVSRNFGRRLESEFLNLLFCW